MKKVALLLPAMRMGGAEKICLNFLKVLNERYDVTLILSKKEGELLKYVPKEIRIMEDRLWNFKYIVKIDIKELNISNLWKDLMYYFKVKSGNDSEKNYRYLIRRTPKIEGHYDCAISYVANVSTQVFNLSDRIDADNKIGWIHGETTEIKNTDYFAKIYNQFDKIFAVSKVTKEHFIERFPCCREITEVYYNPIIPAEILQKAKLENISILKKDQFNIVTVGRLTPEKGMDLIPKIIKKLVKDKYNIHWYIIGEGPERINIETSIQTNEVQKYITMTGNKNNPYPFINRCDLYVQPSYEEGYSTTICEAGILGKAIIGTTSSGGIREQIVDGESGILAEPTVEDITKKIEMLINNKEMKSKLEKNVKEIDFSNSNEFNKIINIIEKGKKNVYEYITSD